MHKLTTKEPAAQTGAGCLNEYPRPQLERDRWLCLNGSWQCAFTDSSDIPDEFPERINVPFCPESELSGLGRVLQPDEFLYYRLDFDVTDGHVVLPTGRLRLYENGHLLLNFGAADCISTIFLNGHELLIHTGGYYPFTSDITHFLDEGRNTLILRVYDPTDTSWQARGKQKLKPGGMFYTPVGGIWQTVWMEAVPMQYISSLRITPDIDEGVVRLCVNAVLHSYDVPDSSKASVLSTAVKYNNANLAKAEGASACASDSSSALYAAVTVFDGDREVASIRIPTGTETPIPVPDPKLWSPESPFLYTFTVQMGEDLVHSYFGMRKFSVGTDDNGIPRLMLNNRPYFHNGLLDQGYWPDGLYTAPTDEALADDIVQMKKLGFNMLRKHAKIEPLRWYYHCDRLGMLVWQDIVNGGTALDSLYVTYRPTILPFTQSHTRDRKNPFLSRSNPRNRARYYTELEDTLSLLYNCVSLSVWVLFNEGWGQFDSAEVLKKARGIDPTRIYDHASGWFDQGAGDLKSLHIYFTPFKIRRDKRPVVISEFGGYTLPTPGHVCFDKVYGYRKFTEKQAFTDAYEKLYMNKLLPLISKGLSAAVYTQVSDIEEEINGLLTYDRKVLKIDGSVVHRINKLLCYDSSQK